MGEKRREGSKIKEGRREEGRREGGRKRRREGSGEKKG